MATDPTSPAALSPVLRARLLRRGFLLEYTTLGWNVVGIVVLAFSALAARSVALAGFGLDSLVEIGASIVVVWELSGTGLVAPHPRSDRLETVRGPASNSPRPDDRG